MMEYAITGGYLRIAKSVFAKEMLVPGSRLRRLLNTANLAQKPLIKKNEADNFCLIDFTHSSEIPLAETYQDLFRSLKEDYGENLQGKVTIRVNTPFNSFFTEIIWND